MKINFFSDKNISTVFTLSNEAFGKNYLPLSYFKKFVNSNKNIGFVAISNKKIIGFITANLYLANSSKKYDELYFNFQPITTDITIIKQVVVSPNYQRKGIGNLLLNQLMETISTKALVCIAWKRNKQIVIENLLLKNNFKKIKSIPNYWLNDSLIKQYNCPECGKPPCKCSGIVFRYSS